MGEELAPDTMFGSESLVHYLLPLRPIWTALRFSETLRIVTYSTSIKNAGHVRKTGTALVCRPMIEFVIGVEFVIDFAIPLGFAMNFVISVAAIPVDMNILRGARLCSSSASVTIVK